jgi:hypothetical protein
VKKGVLRKMRLKLLFLMQSVYAQFALFLQPNKQFSEAIYKLNYIIAIEKCFRKMNFMIA